MHNAIHKKLDGGFEISYLGRFQFDDHIFHMGWNQQLESCFKLLARYLIVDLIRSYFSGWLMNSATLDMFEVSDVPKTFFLFLCVSMLHGRFLFNIKNIYKDVVVSKDVLGVHSFCGTIWISMCIFFPSGCGNQQRNLPKSYWRRHTTSSPNPGLLILKHGPKCHHANWHANPKHHFFAKKTQKSPLAPRITKYQGNLGWWNIIQMPYMYGIFPYIYNKLMINYREILQSHGAYGWWLCLASECNNSWINSSFIWASSARFV